MLFVAMVGTPDDVVEHAIGDSLFDHCLNLLNESLNVKSETIAVSNRRNMHTQVAAYGHCTSQQYMVLAIHSTSDAAVAGCSIYAIPE
jgi:uncharacterized membrane protein YgcG